MRGAITKKKVSSLQHFQDMGAEKKKNLRPQRLAFGKGKKSSRNYAGKNKKGGGQGQ